MDEFNKDIRDVDFEEVPKEEREINGKPLYYNTSQVAQMLSSEEYPVTDSTVRFWELEFKDFLNIKRSGRNRKFTESNIEELRYIKKLLKEDNLKIEQVKEFLSKKDPDVINRALAKQDPIAVKVLAESLMSEVKEEIQDMRELIIAEMNMNIESVLKAQLLENEKLKDKIKELEATLETAITRQEERDVNIVTTLRAIQEENRERLKGGEDKGFFYRLFGKK